jgi:hypothetical protein
VTGGTGATFTYDLDTANPPAAVSVTDDTTAAAPDEDATYGKVCVSGLTPGTYTVDETSPPTGYGDTANSADTSVVVVAGSDCTAAKYPTGTAVASFTNPPLADIQVRFRDGGSGETRLDPADADGITCNNATGSTSTTDTANWDDTETVTGIEAGAQVVTVTCTIPIDP